MSDAIPALLEYAKQARPRQLRINAIAILTTAALLPLFYVALLASTAFILLEYDKTHSWRHVSTLLLSENLRGLLKDSLTQERIWFIPLAILTTALFVFVRRPSIKLAIAACGVAMTLWVSGLNAQYLKWIPIAGPAMFALSLVGRAGGELWAEGHVALGVMGTWMVTWTVFCFIELVAWWRSRGNVSFAKADA